MQINVFREQIVHRVRALKEQQPAALMHLLYSPELADPLRLCADAKRDAALIRPPSGWELPDERVPRLVTLDCRKVAPYLLEADAGLDDPLLEESITQAHRELFDDGAARPELNNDEADAARRAVCGWIVSTEAAQTVAVRLAQFSRQYQNGPRWLRWHDPDRLEHLWPSLSVQRRRALLGDHVTWLAPIAPGALRRFASPTPGEIAAATEQDGAWSAQQLEPAHWTVVANTPLVNELRESWRLRLESCGRTLPADALARLHGLAAQARQHQLDGEDIALYVLTVVDLRSGAVESEPFRHTVQDARAGRRRLRQGLAALPEQFWHDYALP